MLHVKSQKKKNRIICWIDASLIFVNENWFSGDIQKENNKHSQQNCLLKWTIFFHENTNLFRLFLLSAILTLLALLFFLLIFFFFCTCKSFLYFSVKMFFSTFFNSLHFSRFVVVLKYIGLSPTSILKFCLSKWHWQFSLNEILCYYFVISVSNDSWWMLFFFKNSSWLPLFKKKKEEQTQTFHMLYVLLPFA